MDPEDNPSIIGGEEIEITEVEKANFGQDCMIFRSFWRFLRRNQQNEPKMNRIFFLVRSFTILDLGSFVYISIPNFLARRRSNA